MEEDPAAAFLQREHEELGDIGDEILGQPTSQSEVIFKLGVTEIAGHSAVACLCASFTSNHEYF
jgi:hypothetical protein